MKKTRLILSSVLLAAITLPAFAAIAADIAADSTAQVDPLISLLTAIFGSEKAVIYVTAVGAFCYFLTHIVAWVPVSWVAKLPKWVQWIISALAGNYAKAKNAEAKAREVSNAKNTSSSSVN